MSNLPAKYEKRRGFQRDPHHGKVAGVCVGLESGTGIPALVWRLGFLVAFFGWGVGVPVYILLWFAMDVAPEPEPPALPPKPEPKPDDLSPEDREIWEAVKGDMKSLDLRND